MKKTDPKELRKPAAKMFITLLGNDDKVSVVSFSSQAWPITFLTQLNTETNKNKSLKATDRVSSKGIMTNIHAAISKGIELLKNSKDAKRDPMIVLMSDGQLDVGNKKKNAELRQQILDELVPVLKDNNIKIYSIAFTAQSDQTLLQEIADATDGRYALAADDAALHKVFAKIFEQSKEPNMLPLTENKFVADKSIREITIIANKKTPNSKILLESPSGKQLSSTFKKKNLKWFVSNSFDMITLISPEEGEWKILFSDNGNKAYIVADMKLRSEFEYNAESFHPELTIKTWLKKDDNIVVQDELLKSLDMVLEIEHPDGKLDKLTFPEADAEGIFKAMFKPTMDGIYAATVIATSKTFQRQQVFSFRATMPKEPPPPEPEPEPKPEPEPIPEPEPEIKPEPVEPPPPPPEPEPESDLVQALIVFVAGNLILGIIGFGVFFIIKKKSKKT